MGKILQQTTGFLSEIKKPDKKRKYKSHLNVPGVLLLGESEHKYPGKKFIYLFTDNGIQINYFHTSCGEFKEKDNKWFFNNDYVFTIDENCLTSEQKAELLVNINLER